VSRDYRAIYERRKARAAARGTTYGKERYKQSKELAKREGYATPVARKRARENERKREQRIRAIFDQGGWEPGFVIPSRDETDRRIEAMMRRRGAGEGAIYQLLQMDDRWAEFRAWYAMSLGWAS
jgi:hypothetical protein